MPFVREFAFVPRLGCTRFVPGTDVHALVKPNHIDHTLLKATATEDEIRTLFNKPYSTSLPLCVSMLGVTVASMLDGTRVQTCAVVEHPLGAMSSAVKAFETITAIQDGATEIDMVVSIGDVAHDWKLSRCDCRCRSGGRLGFSEGYFETAI